MCLSNRIARIKKIFFLPGKSEEAKKKTFFLISKSRSSSSKKKWLLLRCPKFFFSLPSFHFPPKTKTKKEGMFFSTCFAGLLYYLLDTFFAFADVIALPKRHKEKEEVDVNSGVFHHLANSGYGKGKKRGFSPPPLTI